MKGNYWWRAQNGSVDNTKLIKLSDKAHRNWYNLNCVANANGGVLPGLEDVALKLRMTPARAAVAIAELVSRRLFDKRDDGSFIPHDWNEWQFKTDQADPTNAERQKNFRKRQREEIAAMKALQAASRNALGNGALRNGVTNVTAKRPDTEKNIITTSPSVERGLGNGNVMLSSEALAIGRRG